MNDCKQATTSKCEIQVERLHFIEKNVKVEMSDSAQYNDVKVKQEPNVVDDGDQKYANDGFPAAEFPLTVKKGLKNKKSYSKKFQGITVEKMAKIRKMKINYNIDFTPIPDQSDQVQAFRCALCDVIFAERDFVPHYQTEHPGEMPFNCHNCSYRTWQQWELRLHLELKACDQPIETVVLVAPESFRCIECDLFFNENDFIIHRQFYHQDEVPFKCSICECKFRTQSEFLEHFKTHDKNNNQIHSVKKAKRGCSKRSVCGISPSSNATDLNQSSQEPEKDSIVESTEEIDVVSTTENGKEDYFKCHFCGILFASFATLSHHVRLHEYHKEKREKRNKVDVNREQPISKNIDKNFLGLTNERRLIDPDQSTRRSKTKEFVCDDCNFCFERRFYKAFSQHRLEYHNDETPFLCEYCQMKFIHWPVLTRHIFFVHTGIIQCLYCEKEFTVINHATLHQENFHPQEVENDNCDTDNNTDCDQKVTNSKQSSVLFGNDSHFVHHCKTCEKSFESSLALSNHKRRCKGVFCVCKSCNQVFMSPHARDQHFKDSPPCMEFVRRAMDRLIPKDKNTNGTELVISSVQSLSEPESLMTFDEHNAYSASSASTTNSISKTVLEFQQAILENDSLSGDNLSLIVPLHLVENFSVSRNSQGSSPTTAPQV